MAAVIEIKGLSFSYNGHPVLEDVDLEIGERDFASVVGPNGGGKTTLLRLVLGLLTPTRGTVRVFGEPPARVRRRIGYMPQRVDVDPRFPVSVMDVVLMGRLGATRVLGPFGRADRRAAERVLDEVSLGDLRSRQFSELSGGQRQRVLIARALAGEPELLLLDEPTASLDVGIESELMSLLQRLNERLTIVMVSHDLGFVSQFVKTVVCVKGRCEIHPTSGITGEMINEIYGGGMRMVRHDHRCAEEGHQCKSS